jgi:ATP-binding cassette subfamily B protein
VTAVASTDQFDDDLRGDDIPALATLRRAVARTPVLRRGLVWSFGFAVLAAVGRLVVPILVQLVIDNGFDDSGVDAGYVVWAASLTAGVVILVGIPALVARIRMIRAAEETLYELRVSAFERVHQLSLSDHNEQRRGALVARVTSDVDTITRFVDWGALSWIVETTLIVGVLALMAVYSWQLTVVVVVVMLITGPVVKTLQRRQLRAYDLVRTRVGEFLGLAGEMLGGSETVRAYGYRSELGAQLDRGIAREYRARAGAARYFSTIFALGEIFTAVTLISVTVTFVVWGDGWGLETGEVVAFLLLLGILQRPVSQLIEVLDQTQTALAGWHKVLGLLETEPTVTEPAAGLVLPTGPLSVECDDVSFAYLRGVDVLTHVSVSIPAGTDVAIVGETGSGKTTFARLLVRLADPTAGEIRLAGIAIARVSADARRAAVRMVPQDGFLFDGSIRTNIGYGQTGATDAEIDRVITELGLDRWVGELAEGLTTEVGERGERLSVGERQIVALARAALADPGLLVLDEATSSVDPETEQVLSGALQRLAADRTTVTIAHRLSTAENADLVLVFDGGRLVEQGAHVDLVTAGGRYAELFASWERSTTST